MKTSVNTFVILAAVLSASGIGSAAELREIDGREWEDLTRMSVGREETRASFAPFGDERSALEILPWKSTRQVSLDSETAWKFRWSSVQATSIWMAGSIPTM